VPLGGCYWLERPPWRGVAMMTHVAASREMPRRAQATERWYSTTMPTKIQTLETVGAGPVYPDAWQDPNELSKCSPAHTPNCQTCLYAHTCMPSGTACYVPSMPDFRLPLLRTFRRRALAAITRRFEALDCEDWPPTLTATLRSPTSNVATGLGISRACQIAFEIGRGFYRTSLARSVLGVEWKFRG
jgi:hypothetical protein